MAHLGDIAKVDGGKIPPVHIITFGSPCQNLSLIGNRSGLAGAK
ncbi:MAG: DNA cytosine methyltransferase, partial [Blautia massiliensis (ex Durand et al. 2017)]